MDEIEEKPSRALPIGVAAGLAVAVFGVLFAIRGTGKADGPPVDNPPVATADKPVEPATDKPPADKPPADKPVATTTPTTQTPPASTPDAGRAAVAAAAPPDAGKAAVATTSAPDAAPAAKPGDSGSTLATLTFMVTPKEAASRADITVDKKPVLGDRFQVQKGGTPVKVVVRSSGYVTFEKEIVPSGDQSVPIELKKVETASATSKEPTKTPTVTKTPPTVTKTPTKKPPKKPKVEL